MDPTVKQRGTLPLELCREQPTICWTSEASVHNELSIKRLWERLVYPENSETDDIQRAILMASLGG